MSFPHWGDVPTWVAAGAAICALVGAVLAYRKQSEAVAKQAKQLDLQRQQLDDQRDVEKKREEQLAAQREVNQKQAEVLDLQIHELRASLARSEQEKVERLAAQAKQVSVRLERPAPPGRGVVRERRLTLTIRNDSDFSIRDVYALWKSGRVDSCPRLEAGASTSFPASKEDDDPARRYRWSEPEKDSLRDKVSVYFRDYNGLCWLVAPDGSPPFRVSEDALNVAKIAAKYRPNI